MIFGIIILSPFEKFVCFRAGGAGGKGVWGAAGMVYEMEEPDARDPNYDESAQVSRTSVMSSEHHCALSKNDTHVYVCNNC